MGIRQQLLQLVRRRHRIEVGQVNPCPQQVDGVLGQQVETLGIFQVHRAQIRVGGAAVADAGGSHRRDHHRKDGDQDRQPCANTRVHPIPHRVFPPF